MSGFEAQDPDYQARVRRTFAGQPAMATLGIVFVRTAPGMVELAMPYDGKF